MDNFQNEIEESNNDRENCQIIEGTLTDWMEEILRLRTELHECEMERDQLKTKLEESVKLIRQMESGLLCIDPFPFQVKDSRSSSSSMSSWSDSVSDSETTNENPKEATEKKRHISKTVLDRWSYYAKHKDDENVLAPLREKFKKIGIDKVPWMFVKKRTDELFKSQATKS